MSLSDQDFISIEVERLIDRYRLPGECDECAVEAAALATGYPENDYREGCATEGCRFYDAEYAACMAALDAEYPEGDVG